jgi:hypothetical protein
MPAYLTHAAILIKMTEWLELLRAQIAARRTTFTAAGKPMNALDERLDYLAGQTLFFLREDPTTAAEVALPVTQIKNGVGSQLSKYALVGSLGPDLPAAGYILAMNQDWAWHTLHNGEPRRARKNARTTTFVLKLLEQLEKGERERRLTAAQRRRGISYALGHLSHIAADVVLHPVAHFATWDSDRGALDPLEHQLFEVAIDGLMATGFFQRKSPSDDQSWEDYYLEKGAFKADLTLLMGELSGAFKATYGDDRPNAPVCGLSDPSKCAAPKFDAAFLMDAYRNTTNWAIDVGYDHGPTAWDVFSALLVVTSAALSANSLASGTKSASTITNTLFHANQAAIDELSATAAADWQRDGVRSWAVWRDIITKSISWSNYVALPFEWLFGGGKPMVIITLNRVPKGIFGQNAGVDDSNPAIRTINEAGWGLKTIAFIVLDEVAPKFTAKPWWKWLWFVVDNAHDFIEHRWLKNESRKKNYSEDRLLNATWVPKKILATSNFLGNAVMMLWKASDGRRDSDNNRDAGTSGLDFIAPGVCALFVILIFVAPGNRWRNHLFFKTTKSHWPMSEDRFPARGFLRPIEKDGKMTFAAPTDFVATGRVRLFPDDKLTKDGSEEYYPDGGGDPANVDGQTERDRAARAAAMIELPDRSYPFAELLDHAARFAGLLSMAAVAYDETAAPVRPHMTAIFQDWNLDFTTVDQWKALLEPSIAADMGILHAASLYTADLEKQADKPNEVAIGRLRSALGVTDVAGGFVADFAHTGKLLDLLNAESSGALRLTRPGAVVLPNLDIDSPAPSPLPSPLPSRTGDLDALVDDKINTVGNDLAELTEFRVRKPTTAGAPHTTVLRLNSADGDRVRIFAKNSGPPDTWPVVLGFEGGAAKTEYAIPDAAPAETDYVIELRGFAGDPLMSGPTGPGPLAPAPFGSPGARVGMPVVTERRENEVWIEVIHKDGATEVPGIRDVALFGVAPLLLLDNMKKSERLYVMYMADQFSSGGTLRRVGNHPMVADIIRALQSDGAIAPNVKFTTVPPASGTLDEFVPHRPVRAGDPAEAGVLYLVDGLEYADKAKVPGLSIPDVWVQDEFEICYVHGPRGAMHVILHSPRDGELKDFVERELPAVDVALYDGVAGSADSINFGGNLEVSPPVNRKTARQDAGNAGPLVPEQPPAPLGKIILGEGTPFLFTIPDRFAAELQAGTVSADLKTEMDSNAILVTPADTVEILVADREWLLTTTAIGQSLLITREGAIGPHLRVHAARLAKKEFKHFLEAQRAQPIVTVDTSWLSVGHVDEILIFVPAPGQTPSQRLLMASTQLAMDILRAAQEIHKRDKAANPLSACFRGRSLSPTRLNSRGLSAAEKVEDMLTKYEAWSADLQTRRLTPIQVRLEDTLALAPANTILVPVLYKVLKAGTIDQMGAAISTSARGLTWVTTSAHTPGAVNLQIFNDIALVPRQHVARMKPDHVAEALRTAGVTGVRADQLPPTGNEQWARVGTTTATLASLFGSSAAAIKNDPRNAGKFNASNAVIRNWDRITIPDDTVDLFEAYMHVKLTELGLKVHFIEDWDEYHVGEGEVHCGTNVRRTPAETDSAYTGKKWWECESVTT